MKTRNRVFFGIISIFAIALASCSSSTSNSNIELTPSDETTLKNETYEICFDLDGGTSQSYNGSVTVERFTKDVFFFDCVKENYTFRGWSYEGIKIFDEKGTLLQVPDMAETMTFVALYSQTAILTIVSNIKGAGTLTGAGEYPYNSYVDVSAHAAQGYDFVGWYYENTLLSNTNDYKYMMWSEDITLEARFKPASFLLSIQTNNKDCGLVLLKSSSNANYQPTYRSRFDYKTNITIAAYSKSDIRFLGWYDENNQLVETNAVYSFIMPNHDYSLEAKWDCFIINYVLNEGTNNELNPTAYTMESDAITLHEPTRNGYEFAGWTIDGEIVTEIDPTWIKTITLVANWSAKLNNLSVISDDVSKGAVSITSGSGFSDEEITVVATPIDDCLFKGWYHDGHKVSDDTSYTFTMPINDYSLIAHFITQAEEEYAIRYATIPLISLNDRKITYGLYPQSNIDDSDLISTLETLTTPETNGWYFYDGDYYAKTIAAPFENNYYKFDNGTTIRKDDTYWFKCEPIVWDILSNDNGQYYIISSALLDGQCYYNSSSTRTVDDSTIYPNNYKYSDIRAWLNNGFYDSAFFLNDYYIQITTVINDGRSTGDIYNSYACENTEDKVFMPSYRDYLESDYGFSVSEDGTYWSTAMSFRRSRISKTTDWARARGAVCRKDSSYNGSYWTRSPYRYDPEGVYEVSYEGHLSSGGPNATVMLGVRPGIYIDTYLLED